MKKTKFVNLLIYFSGLIFIFLVIQALSQTGISWFIDFNIASNWGTTLAGVLSFISILLLYLALRLQSEALKRQSETFYVNQFENKYFEQIKYHRDNVASFEYQSPKTKEKDKPVKITGNRVFVATHNEVLKAVGLLEEYFTEDQIGQSFINSEEYNKESKYTLLSDRKISIVDLTKFNVAYLVVFYGVSKQGRSILKKVLSTKYKLQLVESILDKFSSIPVLWSKYRGQYENKQPIPSSANFYKYFGGHQHRLGHYFRHLYQTVTYIDKNEIFTYGEKYEYVKRVRAHFSTYEQSIIFFNSISMLGRVWELDQEEENDQLITKYNLIKNIPAEFISDIKIENYYPLVHFENAKYPEKRYEIEKKYS